jgi:hypothetical protein
MNLNWAQISDTVTTQLTAFGLKAAGAIVVWIVGRYLISLAVRLVGLGYAIPGAVVVVGFCGIARYGGETQLCLIMQSRIDLLRREKII